MLEFHYDEQGHDEGKGEKRKAVETRYQKVPEPAKNRHQFDFRALAETATVPSVDKFKQPALPVASASNATSVVWSTNTSHKKQ